MNIKSNSLLNRFNKWNHQFKDHNPFDPEADYYGTGKPKPMNVCEYFWRTVWSFIRSLMLVFVTLVVITYLIIAPLYAIGALVFGYDTFTNGEGEVTGFAGWGAMVLGLYFVITSCFLLGVFATLLKEYVQVKIQRTQETTKEPSLITEFYRAKKNKFCKNVTIVKQED